MAQIFVQRRPDAKIPVIFRQSPIVQKPRGVAKTGKRYHCLGFRGLKTYLISLLGELK